MMFFEIFYTVPVPYLYHSYPVLVYAYSMFMNDLCLGYKPYLITFINNFFAQVNIIKEHLKPLIHIINFIKNRFFYHQRGGHRLLNISIMRVIEIFHFPPAK